MGARDWPNNRGIFHNDNQTALAWCNEEDHCRIISMKMGGDIPDVFKRFGNLSKALEATGAKLMWNETLGYMGTCPSNLGTGLRASVMIQLKCFNALLENPSAPHEDKELLEQVCAQFDLQPRGSAGAEDDRRRDQAYRARGDARWRRQSCGCPSGGRHQERFPLRRPSCRLQGEHWHQVHLWCGRQGQ